MSNKLKVKQIDGDVGSGIYQCGVENGIFSSTLGGIPSTNAADFKTPARTVSQMLDALLFPYKAPSMSLTVSGGGPTLEVGQPLLSPTLNLAWSTQANPANAQDNVVTVTDNNETAQLFVNQPKTSNGNYTYPSAIVLTSPGSYSWSASGLDSRGQAYSATATKTWRWKRYWGASSNPTVSEILIEGLANKELETGVAESYAFSAGYLYFAWPSNLPLPTAMKAGGFDLALAFSDQGYNLTTPSGLQYRQISVTNAYSQTLNYNVFRSLNLLNGATTVVVS
jgi:hypothetical protein